jgi:hypothetical protein
MPTHNLPEHERATPTRRPAASEVPAADAGAAPHPLLALQRQIGNAQVSRMLAQREASPDEDEEALQAKHDITQREAAPEEDETLQAKHDPALAQREASPDEDEEALQAKHDPALAQREASPDEDEEALQAKHDITQREAAPEEDEELQAKHDLTQRAEEADDIQASPEVGLEGGPISDGLAGRIQAQRGGGSPLAEGTRTSMEQQLGANLEDVRVHTDGESDALNRSISAKAFTTGNDIFFRQDASPSDQSLMAHELTHVVQQRSMPGSGGSGMHVGPAGDSYEQQADATAAAVTSGAAPAAQREHDDM